MILPPLTQEIRDKATQDERKAIIDALNEHNVNLQRVARVLDEELSAFETRPFKGTIKTVDIGGGITVEDTIIYSDPLVAHSPRLKAAELAIALLDIKPSEKHQVNGSINHVAQLTEQDRVQLITLGDKIVDAILAKHRGDLPSD